MNSIEKGFAELKAWCKKHHIETERMGFEEFLEYAMENVKDEAKEHFIHNQVDVSIRERFEEDY